MRLGSDTYFALMASLVSLRGTCHRRRVGCVLVDASRRVLATGYNGVPKGVEHCSQHPCPGAFLAPGTGLDLCEATHAEINALLQCREPDKIDTCYVTASPCVQCVKALMNTGCQRVVFLEEYPHSEAGQWWCKSREPSSWVHFMLTDQQEYARLRFLKEIIREGSHDDATPTPAFLDDTYGAAGPD